MNKSKPFLSIIVPVFNEEKRISNIIKIIGFLKKKKFKSELIIVNDGSTDITLQKIKSVVNTKKIKILSYSKNKGKGYAIKQGMLKSSGKYKLFVDVDLSIPIKSLDKFIKHTKEFPIIIASRRIKGAKIIIRQNFFREAMGRVFTKISQIILGMEVADFTCGFKLFEGETANKIFKPSKVNRWGFDAEIMYLAKIKKFKVKEIPVAWRNDKRTKVKFPQDIIFSLKELISIRINHLIGLY